MIVSDIGDRISNILRALANRLTAADNWGPEGEVGQVLTSRGKGPDDPPPHFQDVSTLISTTVVEQIIDQLPSSPPSSSDGPGTITKLRGASWSNKGDEVDLGGQRFCIVPRTYQAGTITGCRIVGVPSGSATFGFRKCPGASPFPGGLTDITGGADASIVAASDVQVSLVGWDLAVTIGDIFEVELKDVSGFTQVEAFLEITPT